MESEARSQPPIEPLRWVKPPQQERSQRTLRRILDAAEGFIVENGVHALTVSAVVSRAKSSVGAFYTRFPDKMALLSTLHQSECEAALATTDAALAPERWEGVDLAEAFEQVVRFVVRLYVERRMLVLAFKGLSATEPIFAERRANFVREIAVRVRAFLESRADEIPHPDLALASDVCVRILFGTLETETTASGVLAGGGPYPHERFASELARAVLGYLGIPVSRRIPRRGLVAT